MSSVISNMDTSSRYSTLKGAMKAARSRLTNWVVRCIHQPLWDELLALYCSRDQCYLRTIVNFRKSLEDLPHFLVSSIELAERHPTQYIDLKLHGIFDQTLGVRDGRSWFLLPQRECLIGDLTSLDPKTGGAIFLTSEEHIPEVLGARLPYVAGYWEAYHVWMVAEPLWRWNRVLLSHRDVVGEIFKAEETQTISGQEVQAWMRAKETDQQHSKSVDVVFLATTRGSAAEPIELF